MKHERTHLTRDSLVIHRSPIELASSTSPDPDEEEHVGRRSSSIIGPFHIPIPSNLQQDFVFSELWLRSISQLDLLKLQMILHRRRYENQSCGKEKSFFLSLLVEMTMEIFVITVISLGWSIHDKKEDLKWPGKTRAIIAFAGINDETFLLKSVSDESNAHPSTGS